MCINKNNTKSLEIEKSFIQVNLNYSNLGCCLEDLEKHCFWRSISYNCINNYVLITSLLVILLSIIFQFDGFHLFLNYILGVRCIIRNNYFIWEATRPVSNCNFCVNISKPIVLSNVSRDEFSSYAYTSKPIIIKQAFLHWPARHIFSLEYFQNLYINIDDAFRSVDEECQFLHFKSDFISIQDVFAMSEERSKNVPSEKSWYVGWGNCHPLILEEMRKHYPKPHFLPEDCENPSKEYVFMGYDDGATLHLDFINRLMWQAQLKGSKKWNLIPPPECQHICRPLSFVVESGDAILVDTRVWYHGTTITPGEFSVSVQSEYG